MSAKPAKGPAEGAAAAKDDTTALPFEVAEQIKALMAFLRQPYVIDGTSLPLGNVQWGVYAFFDYDNEPIYVGRRPERASALV